MPAPSEAGQTRSQSWFGPVGVAVGVVAYMALVWLTLGELGMTWDEPYFFERQHEIGAWLGDLIANPVRRAHALSPDGLERSWRVARAVPDQHPPIPEFLSLITGSALSWLVGPLRAYRLATVAMFAVAAAVLVRLVGARWGRWAAVGALGTLLFNPRLFADAQQITADVDTGTCWFLAAVAWLRSVETGRQPWLFGLCAGLAIMCKATGVLVFPAMITWALICRPPGWWRPLVWSVPIVPAVMVACMPPWWTHPIARITRWVNAFLDYPQKVPIYYLGTVYDSVQNFLPWHNTIVLTATMVPIGLFALASIGVGGAIRRPVTPAEPDRLSDRTVVAWAGINFATWIVLRMVPGLPAHDGLRQLVPAFFFLPVLAGYGAKWLTQRGTGRGRTLVGRGVVGVCLATSAWATLSMHPYELAYYNSLIGGPRGARAAGMETTYFWDAASSEVLNWMNAHLPRRSTILIAPPPNVRTFDWEKRWGRLRPDLRFLNLDEPGASERLDLMTRREPCFILFQMRQGLYKPLPGAKPSLFARLADAPARFELVPPRVGVRLLAIFDQADLERVMRQIDAER